MNKRKSSESEEQTFSSPEDERETLLLEMAKNATDLARTALRLHSLEAKRRRNDAEFLLEVKHLSGKTMKITGLCKSSTVLDVKTKIQSQEGVPVDQQRLVFGRHQLSNDKKLEEYNIESGSKLHFFMNLRGC